MNLNENWSVLIDSLVNNTKLSLSIPAASAAAPLMGALLGWKDWVTLLSGCTGLVIAVFIAKHWQLRNRRLEIENAILEIKLRNAQKNKGDDDENL